MSELNIFIDEYDYRSPYYIITMVFHDQKNNIQNEDGTVSEEIKERTYDLKCKEWGRII